MNTNPCIHEGNFITTYLNDLHEYQGGNGRHKCPACAFEEGFRLGSSKKWRSFEFYFSSLPDTDQADECTQGNVATEGFLKSLPTNQAKPGRHKCPYCALKEGFEAGLFSRIDGREEAKLELVDRPTGRNFTPKAGAKIPTKKDFNEKETRNRQLGLAGELCILAHEIAFLKKQGKPALAKKVKHVSVKDGDGLGFDILSFDPEGREKHIEVKTTRGDINSPFYLTNNEIGVSKEKEGTFYLYRLFDFDPRQNTGKYYEIKGDLSMALSLKPTLYMAFPKAEEG